MLNNQIDSQFERQPLGFTKNGWRSNWLSKEKGGKMKVISVFMLIVLALPTFVLAHGGDEPRVVLESDSTEPVQAGEVNVSFQMVDTEREKVIRDGDLEVVHEKKLHMFIFDEALIEFRHEHPEFNVEKNRWVVTTTLPRNGNYWVWAQGTLLVQNREESTPEKLEFTTNMKLQVVGGAPKNTTPPLLPPTRSGNDGNSVVTLSKTKFIAGQMAMPTLTISRNDGTTPEITPFLGAKAHVIGVLEDGDALIHAHPVEHGGHGDHDGGHHPEPTTLMIHVVFPEPGNYRLWVQYIDGGVLRTIPLAVKATKQ